MSLKKGMYVKLDNKIQLNPNEFIGAIQSPDGSIHDFIFQPCDITEDDYVFVGGPVGQRLAHEDNNLTTGTPCWEHLVELPVESTRGHWRIWINPNTQMKWVL